ncbi:MAG: hypothetical protein M1352_00935 [Patescibacteria group bacterium]|nr:hypothetical protein [Patescibacteria group bacterium]
MVGAARFLKDSLGWGIGLWLFGYILGFVFFVFVPKELLGWAIMPFGIAVTLWVLFKKIKGVSIRYYLILGIAWTLIAVVFDYLFLVKLLKPTNGYYKLDVYLYYILTLVLPVIFGWYRVFRQKVSYSSSSH